MITIKTGVPGSGKTQSMVAELLDAVAKMERTGQYRPIYTNITGLDPKKVPHKPMADATAWRDCPPEAIIVIDEAQQFGYEAMSTSAKVPPHIADLAVHRKDYSVDIWFITQHPKLLHVALRRQCGKHQHYERKFGLARAFCFEWHHCEDNLSQRKTAVVSQFVFSKAAQGAYLSAEVHTKQSFRWPMWLAVPALAVPIGIYALPNAWTGLYGSMTGQGLSGLRGPAAAANPPVAAASSPASAARHVIERPIPAQFRPFPAPPIEPLVEVAGCVRSESSCACFSNTGKRVEVELDQCQARTGAGMGRPVDVGEEPPTPQAIAAALQADVPVLQYMAQSRQRGR